MDPAAAARAVTASTKAILPVDFTGQPADLDDIRDLADRHGLMVIQDAAHSLGATYKGRPVGTLAHMTVFSFHPAKHVAMGEGGAVVTDDDRLADRLRLLRTHGIAHAPESMVLADQAADNEALPETRRNPADKAPWYYEMQALGYNYRSTDIQCALGLSQLGKLDASLKRREEIAQAYDRAFTDHPLIRLPARLDDRTSAWHLYVIMLNLETMSVSRRQVLETLRAQGIGAHVHYIPLHLQPYYRDRFGHQRGDFPVAEGYYDACVTLPMFPALTDADVERVVASVLASVR